MEGDASKVMKSTDSKVSTGRYWKYWSRGSIGVLYLGNNYTGTTQTSDIRYRH
jgi:hypothetical protein